MKKKMYRKNSEKYLERRKKLRRIGKEYFMKRILLLAIGLFCFSSILKGQDQESSFTMNVSSDTILMGNHFTLTYSLENLEGEFIAPDLSDFRVLSGPNVSSQFSSINGRVSQKSSYTYYLMPNDEGQSQIGEAKIVSSNDEIILEAVSIFVLENPEGIQELFGAPRMFQNQKNRMDTLTEAQKILQKKLKKGKKHKI